MAILTVTTYTNDIDPFSYVRVKCAHDEIQFLSVGEYEPTRDELQKMGNAQDVPGWTQSE